MEWVKSTWYSADSVQMEVRAGEDQFLLHLIEIVDGWLWSVWENKRANFQPIVGYGYAGERTPMSRAEAERKCLGAFVSLCQERQREYGRLAVEAGVVLENALLTLHEETQKAEQATDKYTLRRGVPVTWVQIGQRVRVTQKHMGQEAVIGRLASPVKEIERLFCFVMVLTDDDGEMACDSFRLFEGDTIEPLETENPYMLQIGLPVTWVKPGETVKVTKYESHGGTYSATGSVLGSVVRHEYGFMLTVSGAADNGEPITYTFHLEEGDIIEPMEV